MKNFLFAFICILAINNSFAQGIIVLNIKGSVKTVGRNEPIAKAKNLIYGKLANDQKLILAKGAEVKLSKNKIELCTINKPGTYLVSDLKFVPAPEKSSVAVLSTYVHSFFTTHNSSESKANYKNSIQGISRGGVCGPALEFPFEGPLPMINKSQTFQWFTCCDTCVYKLEFTDLKDNLLIYSATSTTNSYLVQNPSRYFKNDSKYSWTVTNMDLKMVSEPYIFIPHAKSDYTEAITTANQEIGTKELSLSPESSTVAVISKMEEKGLWNYGVSFARSQAKRFKKSSMLSEISEIYYYDLLIKNQKSK